jgi:hypothetical protein
VLALRPDVTPALWALYAAATLPEWLPERDDESPGVTARTVPHQVAAAPVGAGWWMAATRGAVPPSEAAALATLRERMRGREARGLPGRVARRALLDVGTTAALGALDGRLAAVFRQAVPLLESWSDWLRTPLPAWAAPMQRAMNRVLGAAVGEGTDYHVTLYLLPSSATYAGRKGALYVRFPPTTLECAGEPPAGLLEQLHWDLLHNATHACQDPLLDPLSERHGRRTTESAADAYREGPWSHWIKSGWRPKVRPLSRPAPS